MTLPTVTCVVTAYNHARFVAAAVGSALAQDYPAELLDVVVVNDGSTDGTGEVLDSCFGSESRVRIIHQANAGFVGAMNAAIGAARGELIGILDADDTWPPDRLARQVPILVARPEVGLVHGDMEIVDEHERVLNPSFFRYSGFDVPRGRVLGKLMKVNFVAGGATLVRSSLREFFHPIPEALVYPDWYIAGRVGERAEIDHVDGAVNNYRMHGANMGLGTTGRRYFSGLRNNVRIQRWMLGNLMTDSEPLADLGQVVEMMINGATQTAFELNLRPADVLPVTAEQRAAAAALELEADGEPRGLIRALALDPWNGSARASLAIGLARLARGPGAAAGPAAPQTRGSAVIAFADELLGNREMLSTYGTAIGDATDATLVIHTSPGDAQATAEALGDAVAAAGLDAPSAPDLLLYPCEDLADLLAAPVRAIYTRRGKPAELTTFPRVDDSDVERLADLLAT